jgi:hypothetical protein
MNLLVIVLVLVLLLESVFVFEHEQEHEHDYEGIERQHCRITMSGSGATGKKQCLA